MSLSPFKIATIGLFSSFAVACSTTSDITPHELELIDTSYDSNAPKIHSAKAVDQEDGSFIIYGYDGNDDKICHDPAMTVIEQGKKVETRTHRSCYGLAFN